eukprot:gene4475-4797_t
MEKIDVGSIQRVIRQLFDGNKYFQARGILALYEIIPCDSEICVIRADDLTNKSSQWEVSSNFQSTIQRVYSEFLRFCSSHIHRERYFRRFQQLFFKFAIVNYYYQHNSSCVGNDHTAGSVSFLQVVKIPVLPMFSSGIVVSQLEEEFKRIFESLKQLISAPSSSLTLTDTPYSDSMILVEADYNSKNSQMIEDFPYWQEEDCYYDNSPLHRPVTSISKLSEIFSSYSSDIRRKYQDMVEENARSKVLNVGFTSCTQQFTLADLEQKRGHHIRDDFRCLTEHQLFGYEVQTVSHGTMREEETSCSATHHSMTFLSFCKTCNKHPTLLKEGGIYSQIIVDYFHNPTAYLVDSFQLSAVFSANNLTQLARLLVPGGSVFLPVSLKSIRLDLTSSPQSLCELLSLDYCQVSEHFEVSVVSNSMSLELYYSTENILPSLKRSKDGYSQPDVIFCQFRKRIL